MTSVCQAQVMRTQTRALQTETTDFRVPFVGNGDSQLNFNARVPRLPPLRRAGCTANQKKPKKNAIECRVYAPMRGEWARKTRHAHIHAHLKPFESLGFKAGDEIEGANIKIYMHVDEQPGHSTSRKH